MKIKPLNESNKETSAEVHQRLQSKLLKQYSNEIAKIVSENKNQKLSRKEAIDILNDYKAGRKVPKNKVCSPDKKTFKQVGELVNMSIEALNEAYGRRWKPSKSAAREFAQKMDEIDTFCQENGIKQSKSSDSYYFIIDGKEYRVSNHSIEASNRGAYDDLGNQVRDKYHADKRSDDIQYIHAGKTRIIDIYNDLKNGYKLDGSGNRINESMKKKVDEAIVNGISDRPLTKNDFYYSNEKPEYEEPLELNAVELSKLDKDSLLEIFENAPIDSKIHGIYDRWWTRKELKDGKKPTESIVKKEGFYKQNYGAPMPTKYYDTEWKVSGSKHNIYEMKNIILGKSKYYFVSDGVDFSGLDNVEEGLLENNMKEQSNVISEEKGFKGLSIRDANPHNNPLYTVKDKISALKKDMLKQPYLIVNSNRWYDPEGLNVQDKELNIRFAGTKEECEYNLQKLIDEAENCKDGSKMIEDKGENFVTIYYPHAISKKTYTLIKNNDTIKNESLKTELKESHYDDYKAKVENEGYTQEEIDKVIALADDYESKAERHFITYEQMDEFADKMGLDKMSDSELKRAWSMYYHILSMKSFENGDMDNYRKYGDAASAFAEIINREARKRKEAGNYNPDRVDESLLQDLHNDHEEIRKEYGQEVYDALDKYIEENDTDLGKVIYSEKEWNKFKDYCKSNNIDMGDSNYNLNESFNDEVIAYDIDYDVDTDEIIDMLDDITPELADNLDISYDEYKNMNVEDKLDFIEDKIRHNRIKIAMLFDLPEEINIPYEISNDEDLITEYISDETGFIINGYKLSTDDELDNYDSAHAEEWMNRHPYGYYNNEDDYGVDAEELNEDVSKDNIDTFVRNTKIKYGDYTSRITGLFGGKSGYKIHVDVVDKDWVPRTKYATINEPYLHYELNIPYVDKLDNDELNNLIEDTKEKMLNILKNNLSDVDAEELNEDWTHFTFTSGANPYISKNEKDKNRMLRKYRGKIEKIKDNFYEIDDSDRLDEEASGNEKFGRFTIMYEDGVWVCPDVEHWFHSKYECKSYLEDLEEKIDDEIGRQAWDSVKGSTFDGFRIYKDNKLVEILPINTDLDSFYIPNNKLEESNNPLKDAAKKHRKKQKGMSPFSYLTPNAGNPKLNMDMFNMAMGSEADGTCGQCSVADAGGMGESLKEDLSDKEIEDSVATGVIIDAIKDEYEAIEKYNGGLNTLKNMNADKDLIDTFEDITKEEQVHVGQLEKALETVSPSAKAQEEGEQEFIDDMDEALKEDKEDTSFDEFKSQIYSCIELYEENALYDDEDVFGDTEDGYAIEVLDQNLFDIIFYAIKENYMSTDAAMHTTSKLVDYLLDAIQNGSDDDIAVSINNIYTEYVDGNKTLKEGLSMKNIDIQELLDKFGEKYDYLYNAYGDGTLDKNEEEEAVDYFDTEFLKKAQDRDSAEFNLLSNFNNAREDFISSDREAAAFILALRELCDLNEQKLDEGKLFKKDSSNSPLAYKAGEYVDDWGTYSSTYRGVPGTIYVWHGAWSDPEIVYKDQLFNYWDVEDALWDDYREYCKENDIICDEDDDDSFNKFVQDHFENVLWDWEGEPIEVYESLTEGRYEYDGHYISDANDYYIRKGDAKPLDIKFPTSKEAEEFIDDKDIEEIAHKFEVHYISNSTDKEETTIVKALDKNDAAAKAKEQVGRDFYRFIYAEELLKECVENNIVSEPTKLTESFSKTFIESFNDMEPGSRDDDVSDYWF